MRGIFSSIMLVVSNLCLILSNRSWSQSVFSSLTAANSALLWVVGGVVWIELVTLYIRRPRSA